MAINQLTGQQDRYNDNSQWETDDATVYQTIRFSNPVGFEAGRLTIDYNAINPALGLSVNKMKMVEVAWNNGVAAVTNLQQIFGSNLPNNSPMKGVDIGVIAQGSDVIITLTGASNATIRHTVKILKNLSTVIY